MRKKTLLSLHLTCLGEHRKVCQEGFDLMEVSPLIPVRFFNLNVLVSKPGEYV